MNPGVKNRLNIRHYIGMFKSAAQNNQGLTLGEEVQSLARLRNIIEGLANEDVRENQKLAISEFTKKLLDPYQCLPKSVNGVGSSLSEQKEAVMALQKFLFNEYYMKWFHENKDKKSSYQLKPIAFMREVAEKKDKHKAAHAIASALITIYKDLPAIAPKENIQEWLNPVKVEISVRRRP